MIKTKIVIIGAGTLGLFLGSQILKNKKKNLEVIF
jgi:L-2-hydroxyglutarate oxidase LhgO